MKKFYLLAVVILSVIGGINAQCTIDANAQTTPGANPIADKLPCIVQGQPYDETVQGKIQQSQDTVIIIEAVHIDVDSVRIDSIAGLPNGITWVKNPNVLPGGGNGCVRFTGTTSDSARKYPIRAFGTVWFHGVGQAPYPIDTHIVAGPNRDISRFSPFGPYYLNVITPGDTCHKELFAGIKGFSQTLNTAFNVYPNPSNGVFNVKLDAGQRLDGQLVVLDATGRNVYAQKIDILGLYDTNIDLRSFGKGLYVVQLRTSAGSASKTISIE